MRLTASVRQKLLDLNEGFQWKTYYEGKNFREGRVYLIKGGELLIRASGKTSWADSRFRNEWVADSEETRRFLRKVLDHLNTEGLE